MSRKEWLEWRRMGIGSSDAPAVAGVDAYRTPMAVWLEKTGQVELEDEQSEAAYWGSVLEDVVAREFARRTGYKVRRRLAILQHPRHPFMLANLDRVVTDDAPGRALLEVKTTSAYANGWSEDRVPDRVMVQVQHQLAVTGYERAYVAVLIGGQRYQHYRIDRDDQLISDLIRIERDFWRLVETRTPPEWDGSDAAAELLKRLYPEAEAGKTVALPAEAEELLRAYDEAKRAEAEAAERRKEAENRLKALLGSAETGTVGDRRVIWRNVVQRRLDSKRLQAERPDVYEAYLTETAFRRFEVR
ncbi:MAG: YqaJ viral recombinase family protein [Clostridia bacterium]|nr:YqaJ viral recombinase family protein [Clostridia bacterium]